MAGVEETIPDALAAEAEVARAWFSRERGSEFKLTGIVDPTTALEAKPGSDVHKLQLILCGMQDGQDVCLRESFEVRREGESFDVANIPDPPLEVGSPAPELDPPRGVRASWLDAALAKHAFVVLVFYRGFW